MKINASRPASIGLLIVDMDNTLYDWVGYFVPAVEAMLKQATRLLRVTDDELREDLRLVHIAHGNTEHPFALLETNSVQMRLPTDTPAERYHFLESAFAAFEAERATHLQLYIGVRETLQVVKQRGCLIVGHTEATDVNISSRIRRLGLNGLLDAVYAPTFVGPPHPLGYSAQPSDTAVLLRSLPSTARKPAPLVVRRILSEMGVTNEQSLYVGDNLEKDIRMAKEAGVWAAWARYGTRHDPNMWQSLLSLSHWQPSVSVAAIEHDASPRTLIDPDIVLDSFAEVLETFSFGKSSDITE